MINYSTEELYKMNPAVVPTEKPFTALNGAFETWKLTVEDVDFTDEEKGSEDLRKVLDILRSNGAQPIVTKVEDATTIKFSIEQNWVYGFRGAPKQVSDRALVADATADIEGLFEKAGMKATAEFVSTIGNLCEDKESDSSAS